MRNNSRGGAGRAPMKDRPKPEFDQEIIDIARVSRMVAGGRRFRFRATVVIGDRKGRVGFGTAKGADVSLATEKAVKRAKKTMIRVPLMGAGTIPHEVHGSFKASKIYLKPAPPGTGLIAGGAIRTILELAGVRNVFGKMYGTSNGFVNLEAAMKALTQLEMPEQVEARRGVKVSSLIRGAVKRQAVLSASATTDAPKAVHAEAPAKEN